MATGLTGILEFIGDRGATIWSGFVDEEASQDILLIHADDRQGQLNELGPGLGRSAGGRRDIVEIFLTVHEGEMEFPELFWGGPGDLINE